MQTYTIEGDLLEQDVEVIVNAWNQYHPVVAFAASGSLRCD